MMKDLTGEITMWLADEFAKGVTHVSEGTIVSEFTGDNVEEADVRNALTLIRLAAGTIGMHVEGRESPLENITTEDVLREREDMNKQRLETYNAREVNSANQDEIPGTWIVDLDIANGVGITDLQAAEALATEAGRGYVTKTELVQDPGPAGYPVFRYTTANKEDMERLLAAYEGESI